MFAFLQKSKLTKPNKHFLKSTQRCAGYIVLVPEIGEDADANDAILNPDGLPAFNDITIENCLAAIGHQAAAVENTVKRIETAIIEQKGKVQTAQIFRELDEVTGPLNTTWGVAKALYLGNCTLIPTKSYMNIHERARNARASKYNCKALYDAMEAKQSEIATSKVTYENNEQRLLQKYLLEGKLNGLRISEKQRQSLREVVSELGKERTNYKNKVNISVHTFNHTISDYQIVRDFPPELMEATAKDPNQPMEGPWKISLQPQIVNGFLKYCPDRQQRWNIWQADVRKASGQSEKSLENSTHVEKIRSLRQRQANILGYPNFVAMSMQTKMVGSVEQLKDIFAKLLQFAGPAQSVEINELQSFASERGLKQKLELYDIPYWQRKYLISTYNLDEQKLREYFPLPRVLSSLFRLSERLLGIRIVERNDAEVWQPAVKYYDVFDNDIETGSSVPIGGFYVDCYSKENRYGKNNGWMVGIRNRNEAAKLNPLCALIFNFSAPVYGKPYLLNFDDLHMVFKTFGTALQHLLTRAAFTDLAGLSNIEWDASQISGNVMSNFLNDNKILKSISCHYGNDEQITDEMSQSMQLLRTNMAGFNLCRELYLADLDIELHQSTEFWRDIVKRLWPVYNLIAFDKRDAHPCSLTEIFSGDWAAAQFSHIYSKLIAADISDDFTQNSKDMQSVGKRYKSTFLASGGTIPTAEVFRRFRGRDPSEEALLRSLNIYQTSETTADV